MKELYEKRAKLVAQLRKLHDEIGERKATSEEQGKLDKINGEIDGLTDAIDRGKALEEKEKLMSTLQDDPGVKAAPGKGTQEDQVPLRKAAFAKFLRSGLRSLTPDELKLFPTGRDGMTAGSDSDGGYLVTPMEIMEGIIKKVGGIFKFRELCQVIPLKTAAALGQATMEGLDDFEWTTEIKKVDDDKMTFGRRVMQPHPMRKRIKVSEPLLRLTDAEKVVTDEIANVLARTQERAYMTGDGVGKPLGLFTVDEKGIGAGRDISFGAIGVFDDEVLLDMVFGIRDGYLPGARWIMNKGILKLVRKMKDLEGRPMWIPALSKDMEDTLLGYPVTRSEEAPTATESGNRIAVFGNPAYYRIVDAMDMKLTKSEHIYIETNQVGFFPAYEGDGQPIQPEAFICAKTSA